MANTHFFLRQISQAVSAGNDYTILPLFYKKTCSEVGKDKGNI